MPPRIGLAVTTDTVYVIGLELHGFDHLVPMVTYVTRRLTGTLIVTMGLHAIWDFVPSTKFSGGRTRCPRGRAG